MFTYPNHALSKVTQIQARLLEDLKGYSIESAEVLDRIAANDKAGAIAGYRKATATVMRDKALPLIDDMKAQFARDALYLTTAVYETVHELIGRLYTEMVLAGTRDTQPSIFTAMLQPLRHTMSKELRVGDYEEGQLGDTAVTITSGQTSPAEASS